MTSVKETVFWPILEEATFRTFGDIYTRNPELVGNLKEINFRDSQALGRDFIWEALGRDFIYTADVIKHRLNVANNKPLSKV